ncbi:MAG: orotidine-5'-phosphate decarboxylase [Candidatus Puniceispirillales bacterium]
MNFADKITLKTREIGSPICLGLDPHPNLIPKLFKKNSQNLILENVENFLFEIIDIAKNKVVAIKPQVAFFEQWGPDGMSLLVKVSKLAQENNILVIMDAKRGDIGSTSSAYAKAWLGKNSPFGANALTVNPWMGLETLFPFIEVANESNSGIFILLKTSNAGSKDIQDLLVNNRSVFLHVADFLKKYTSTNLGKFGYSDIGVVVGATQPKEAKLVRKILPKSLFLIPGFGAQGANSSEALSGLILKNRIYEGGLINSSRSILFPKDSYDLNHSLKWKEKIVSALKKTTNELKFKAD